MDKPTPMGIPLSPIAVTDRFAFCCHPGVSCFTECCRMLELALTPYDVLRLRQATGYSSEKLLSEYIISEQDPGEPFPRFYLTMVDDGRASCVFVGKEGCSVYDDRPGACRAYPLGRAVSRNDKAGHRERYVLLREPHCQGFNATTEHVPQSYMENQQLMVYNRFNDSVMTLLQHQAIRDGFIPSHNDIELFILTLYNLDAFRALLQEDRFDLAIASPAEKSKLLDDEYLLDFGIEVLHKNLFPPF